MVLCGISRPHLQCFDTVAGFDHMILMVHKNRQNDLPEKFIIINQQYSGRLTAIAWPFLKHGTASARYPWTFENAGPGRNSQKLNTMFSEDRVKGERQVSTG
jgi:hypothetical protein